MKQPPFKKFPKGKSAKKKAPVKKAVNVSVPGSHAAYLKGFGMGGGKKKGLEDY